MDADPRLVAASPRLVGGARPLAPGKPRRPGLWRLIALLAVAGVGVAAWGVHRAMAARGTLRITTKPAGATIEVEGMSVISQYPEDAGWWDPDGSEITWSRPLTVYRQPGTYEVTVNYDGYKAYAVQAVIRAGQTTAFDIELVPRTDLRLDVSSTPAGRTVSIDSMPVMHGPHGHEQAKTNLTVDLIGPGRHRIEIPGDCRYQPWRQEIVVQTSVVTRVEAVLEPWPFKPSGCSEKEWRGED